jgi:hypothetical protein
MITKRCSLLLALSALACSRTATTDPTPATKDTAATVAPTAEKLPVKAPEIDRSPIAVTQSPEKLVLTATKLDIALFIEDRVMMGEIDNRVLVLHPLRDRMLVSYAGHLAALNDQQLEFDAPFFPPELYEIRSIVGTWPQAGIAEAEFNSYGSPFYMRVGEDGRDGRTKRTEHYHWSGNTWRGGAPAAGAKAATFREGSILALQSAAGSPPGPPPKGSSPARTLAVMSAVKDVPTKHTAPKQAPPRDPALCKDALTEVVPEELDALPTGEAFVLGKRCGAGGYAMERWSAGAAESVTDDLPDAPLDAKRAFISANAQGRLHVMLSTGSRVYAARWDGQAFRKIELQDEGEVRSMWTAADGTLFFVLQPRSTTGKKTLAELVRVQLTGQLTRSTGFAAGPNMRVWAADAQTAHFVSYASIFSTKSGLAFTKVKAAEPPARAIRISGLPLFAEGCATPFVFLYDVSEKSPPGFDFPSTRKALSTFAKASDISLVEFMYESKRRLGVRVPSADVGHELVKHVAATMKDEDPALVCVDPTEKVRVIPI